MKKMTVILFALILSSCTSTSWLTGERAPSSESLRNEYLDNPHLQNHFAQLFAQPQAVELFQNAFKEYQQQFFHNQALIYAYDDALENNIDPIETPLYEEIWMGRNLKEHAEEQLAYFLVQLDELSTRNDDLGDKATLILEAIYNDLYELEDHQKAVYVDVIKTFRELDVHIPTRQKSLRTLDVTAPFKEFSDDNFSWSDFYDQHQDSLREEADKQASLQNLRPLYQLSDTQRKSLIRPSVGREGNLLGGNFPAGTWSLTYDDGPNNTTTREIINLLSDANIPATFFWLARLAQRNTTTVQIAKDKGFELANHSYSHENLPRQTLADQRREIVESTDILQRVYAQPVRFFRLPYGSGVHHSGIREMIANRGLIHVFWNVDSLDWQDRDPRSIHRRVTSQMQARGQGIILFHDIHRQSVEATRYLIDTIRQTNRRSEVLKFRTLGQIVATLNNTPMHDGPSTTTALRVRTSPAINSTNHCATLPAGTPVVITGARQGDFVPISVVNPSAGLSQELATCGGSFFVSIRYLQ
jgi:peptidoglycan/xylan/chitin deacetylase (PgdA/CDA1 family)